MIYIKSGLIYIVFMFNAARKIPFLYEFHRGILWQSRDYMIPNAYTSELEMHETILNSPKNLLLICCRYLISN